MDDDIVMSNETFVDEIAARCAAYRDLMATLCATSDEELRKEGLLMLRSVRMSFKTHPAGDLRAIDGARRE